MPADDAYRWLTAMRRAVAKSLEGQLGDWTEDGERVLGPGTLAVQVTNTHESAERHVDLGFQLNRNRADAPVVWDCLAGPSGELEGSADFVCRIWKQTTAPTILELLTGRGEFADHSNGDASLGLRTWHSIHGGILAYGKGDGGPALQAWCLENPIVPLLSAPLTRALKPGVPHGVKFLLGAFANPIAEVRIDGDHSDECSEALLTLPWPKTGDQVARFYVLFVHHTTARGE